MRCEILTAYRIWRKAPKILFASMPRHLSRRCSAQRSPTCSAQTASPAVTPPAKKDEPADAGKDFCWKDDDGVVLREQPGTAVHFNRYGGLVIRQYGWPEDDSIVVISAECIDHFVDKLSDIVGIESSGR